MKSTTSHRPRKSVKLTRLPSCVSSSVPGISGGCRCIAMRRAVSLVKAWKRSVAAASTTIPSMDRTTLASSVRSTPAAWGPQQTQRDAHTEVQHGQDNKHGADRTSLVISQPLLDMYRISSRHTRPPGGQERHAENQYAQDIDREG